MARTAFPQTTPSHRRLLFETWQATSDVAQRLPAVSGSSGRLVVYGPRVPATEAAPAWPGQVFTDPEVPYRATMHAFVRRSAPRTPRRMMRAGRSRPPALAAQ